MELMHNQIIKLLDDGSTDSYPPGTYRVIFEEPITGIVVTVCLQRLAEEPSSSRIGRPRLEKTRTPRKKPLPRLVGDLIWMEREKLKRLHDRSCLIPVTLEREALYLQDLDKDSNVDSSPQLSQRTRPILSHGFVKEFGYSDVDKSTGISVS
jgi:hypothetical protein